MADNDQLRRRIDAETAKDINDRNRVRVMRPDGQLDPDESARITTNNIISDIMQRQNGRMGSLSLGVEEPDARRRAQRRVANQMTGLESGMKKGGAVKMAAGGKVRGCGAALRGKTRGKIC